jgi:proline dehydrogenase
LIMMDAEQSYLQIFIDYLAASYFKLINKENCLLMTTMQCYLKKEPENIKKIFRFCRENNLSVGIKLVRGAYMNEENRISEQIRVESPINSDIESTHENYTWSIKYIFEHFRENDKVSF